jgi:hypothetical protein
VTVSKNDSASPPKYFPYNNYADRYLNKKQNECQSSPQRHKTTHNQINTDYKQKQL